MVVVDLEYFLGPFPPCVSDLKKARFVYLEQTYTRIDVELINQIQESGQLKICP